MLDERSSMAVKPFSSVESSPKNALTVWLVASAVLLLVAAAGAFFLLRTSSSLPESRSEDVSVPPPPAQPGSQQRELGPLIPVEEFIVNLIGEDITHYLKISLSIEVSDKEAGQELLQRMPQVRDAILLLASNKTFEELYDLHGKKQLKAELLAQINEILAHGSARSIYFTDFVIQ